jgi:hypothetical protein
MIMIVILTIWLISSERFGGEGEKLCAIGSTDYSAVALFDW